eukprot:m.249655 g.249655  ORF g.249655 m.249655 type:complete len:637 (+) comp15428_c1_seq3:54-1964(+)
MGLSEEQKDEVTQLAQTLTRADDVAECYEAINGLYWLCLPNNPLRLPREELMLQLGVIEATTALLIEPGQSLFVVVPALMLLGRVSLHNHDCANRVAQSGAIEEACRLMDRSMRDPLPTASEQDVDNHNARRREAARLVMHVLSEENEAYKVVLQTDLLSSITQDIRDRHGAVAVQVAILSHLASRSQARTALRVPDVIDTLAGVVQQDVEKYGVVSAACSLALLLGHEDSHSALTLLSDTLVHNLLKAFQATVRGESFEGGWYNAPKLAEALGALAGTQPNAEALGNAGAVEMLVSAMSSAYTKFKSSNCIERSEDIGSIANALWSLSFADANKARLQKHPDAATLLNAVSVDDTLERCARRNASGVLWELRGATTPAQQHPAHPHPNNDEDKRQATDTHIMLSYSWTQQDVMLRVYQALTEHGLTVWMDVDQMSGSTLEAMAQAVEAASVVCIGVSRQYKESVACRTEAEYAYVMRRPCIPLILDSSYTPDGWLGALLGSQLWIDFSNDSQTLDKSIEILLTHIGKVTSSTKISPPTQSVCSQQHQPHSVVAVTKSSVLEHFSTWTVDEVGDWLDRAALSNCKEPFVRNRVCGRALSALRKTMGTPQFRQIVLDDFKVPSVADIVEGHLQWHSS